MLRNLNATYAGQRILASPYVGVLAETIAAETATGDHGPGILYNEAIDPAYAGKYLRAWITNPPTVGSLSVAENGAIEGYDLPVGVHTFNYDLLADDTFDSASYFTVAVGVVDATAAGATLTGTASIVPGSATGETVIDATAPGAELTGTSTITPGSAAGEINASAPGADLTGTSTLTPGAASGEVSATAPGADLTGSATITPGTAVGESAGSATAPGANLTGTATILPGTASGQISATAPGAELTGTATLTSGAATGNIDATAPGSELTGTATIIPGAASDGSAVLEPGPAAWWVRSMPRQWTVRSLPRPWTIRSNQRTARGEIMPLPYKDPAEIKTVTFDFSADAESLTNATLSASYLSGPADASPSNVLSGSRTVDGPLVIQRVKAGQDTTAYAIRCEATDADGEVHVIAVTLPVRTAVPV